MDHLTTDIGKTHGPRVYLETFGCQMNELDSELVRGHLAALGYAFTPDASAAEVILYNTCSVREQAENKVLSRLGIVGNWKKEGRSVVVGVIGCMAEREGSNFLKRFPQIDLLCGPGELDKLPMLIDNVFRSGAAESVERIALQGNNSRRTTTLTAATDNLEMLDLGRAFDPDFAEAGGRSAYVRITRGCNKFCTYCVVPYTRGAEVHRPPDSIVDECRMLADRGVIEVTLLGQTVNHYVYVHGAAVTVGGVEVPQVGPGLGAFAKQRNGIGKDGINGAAIGEKRTTFATLLKRIHDEVPAIQRLRFVTSYPRDFGDDALAVMAESPRICRYLHVPAQSGSNRILKLMNRGYTVEEYEAFIERARRFMPDVSVAGDIIVGFPTETDEDFEQTMALIERVRFKNNFVFKYSPRPGTIAIDRYADDVPDDVKRRRNNELLALQVKISEAVHREQIGREVEVFVEKVSSRESRQKRSRTGNVELGWERSATQMNGESVTVQMSGRTGGDLIAVFDAPRAEAEGLIGSVARVRITGAQPLLLEGERIESTSPATIGAA